MSDAASDRYPHSVRSVTELPWVISVEPTDRADATHKIITERSLIRTNHEIAAIENCGPTVTAYSQVGHYGLSIYVTAV